MDFRVGFGYDVHQLGEGEELWLGGILVEHEKGAIGHSDADVVLHVICDALLGAANMRDIGFHFPDTSDDFKGIDSKILLAKTVEIIRNEGYEVGNIDVTLALQRPKVKPIIPEMQETIANTMNVDISRVSLKATTTEKLGFTGREEGIACHAVVLLSQTS